MVPSYLDFDLRLEEVSPGDYRVAVVSSPVGEVTAAFRLPFTDLEKELLRLENAVLRSAPPASPRRRLFSEQEREAQRFGRQLFDALLCEDIRSLYDQSRQAAGERGLRIRLRINDSRLAAIPWEFLYDSRGAGSFIALSLRTPLVRYLETPHPARDIVLRQDEPVRVLGMIAAPEDQPGLDTEQEHRNLQNAVKDVPNVQLEWVQGETWRDLADALDSAQWHIFHFIGHGLFDRRTSQGMLALCNERRTTHALSATELSELISDHFALRFVFLNSCESAKSADDDRYSSTASILVANGIPAVLAMQYEIYDKSALEFSRAIYVALARGDSVDRAVTQGRKAIKIGTQNVMEWGTPVLTTRLKDGVLFRRESPVEQMVRIRAEQQAAEPLAATEAELKTNVQAQRKEAERLTEFKDGGESEEQPEQDELGQDPTERAERNAQASTKQQAEYQAGILAQTSFEGKARRRARYAAATVAVVIAIATLILVITSARNSLGSLPPLNTPSVTANDQWAPIIQSFDAVDMVQVPAGCFMMGSNNGEVEEKPVHRACFAEPFWIDQTEVTNAQFAVFNGQAAKASAFSGGDRPRDSINWSEARDFW